MVRSTLLLDTVRLGLPLRRAAFGPELSYGLGVERGVRPVHRVVPFTGLAIDLRAETADGLWAASLGARAGAALRVPGGWRGFAEGTLLVERVVLAVNDEPVAAFLSLARRDVPGGSRLEAAAGLRLALGRRRVPAPFRSKPTFTEGQAGAIEELAAFQRGEHGSVCGQGHAPIDWTLNLLPGKRAYPP